jgi:hypothetical protein
MQSRRVLLCLTLLGYVAICRGEELDGSLHFTGGTNKNPTSAPAISAGLHLDPALFLPMKSQFFDAGLAYDRVQGRSGVTTDFRAKLAFLRCYGSEYQCEARKRFWLTAIASVGKRWGDGGLGGYAATQVQAVFDLRRELACCKFAIGVQHRFPFDSSLHADNALVLELRMPMMFRDYGHPPPPIPPKNPAR